jgi:threonine/homoserine/homoserine lactone efflux protein
MTVLQALLSFAVVAGLLTLVPGIDTALVVRSVLTRGRGYAFGTAAGIVTGALLWGAGAAAGASALLAASTLAYRLLTVAGAAYLVLLGLALLRKSFRHEPDAAPAPAPPRSLLHAYTTGVWTNLLNPKVGVFYVATIPQFLPPHTVPVLMGLALAGVHAALTLAWFTVLIVGGALAARSLRSRRAARIIDRVTGAVLVGFGLRLALEPR